MSYNPSINVILAPWSSGSTSVSGYLHKLGYPVPSPHVSTNDARTENSFEPKELMRMLADQIDEISLKLKTDDLQRDFSQNCLPWIEGQVNAARDKGLQGITLKHPMLAFHVESLITMPNINFIVVMRSLADIEATRQRRKWAPVYGQAGAVRIYNKIFSSMLSRKKSLFAVHYDEFRNSQETRAALRRFIKGSDSIFDQVKDAENWVR